MLKIHYVRSIENMKLLLLLILFSAVISLHAEKVSLTIEGKELGGELNHVGKEKTQIAFILSGSGPTDKDGNTAGLPGPNNSLLYLSHFLNNNGISTLRIDKRGIASSAAAAPKEADLRFSTYVEDVKHWIDFLRSQGYSEILLVGHSEGALVATQAASSPSVTGLISIAGAGRPAPEVLREQLKPKLPDELYQQADVAISKLTEGKVAMDYPPSLHALFRPSVQPYLISWFPIDPAKAIAEVKVPILIVQGSTDLQITIQDANLLHKGAKGSKLVIVQGMNHILKEIKGDLATQIPSYSDPALALHKDLGPAIVEFIQETKKAEPAP